MRPLVLRLIRSLPEMIPLRRFTAVILACPIVLATGLKHQVPAQRQKVAAAATHIEADAPESEMRAIIEYYIADRGSLARSYPVATSKAHRERFRKFYADALVRIEKLNFDSMSEEGKVDYVLFKNHLEHELRQLDIEARQQTEIAPLVPFAQTIIDLEESRRRLEPIDSAKTAATLTNLRKQIDDTRKLMEAGLKADAAESDVIRFKKTVAYRAVGATNSLRNALRNWYTFYNGYDPLFTWWNEEPYKALDQALANYAAFVGERLVGLRPEGTAASSTAPNRAPAGGVGAGQGQ